MLIKDIKLRKIFDSRANPTIEVEIFNDKENSFRAEVSAGKSRGSREVKSLDFESADRVMEEIIKPHCVDNEFSSIKEFDEYLIKLDTTNQKEKLGGNVILALSMAFTRGIANEQRKEDWQAIRDEFFKDLSTVKMPSIYSNFINGGSHANNNLDIQEYWVIAKPQKSVLETIEKLITFYKSVGDVLRKKYKKKYLAYGDEAGYVLDFKNNFEPIKLLGDMIVDLGFEHDFKLGLDVAASEFYKGGKYKWEGKSITSEALIKKYLEFFKKSPFLQAIEDPFHEDDKDGFEELRSEITNKLIIGDDLTTTNPDSIKEASNDNLISGVIIKPTQIGSVSESCEAIKRAHAEGIKTIISHRSGETGDNFLVHLAKSCNAEGVKIGAPFKERMLKFNELIRLYQ